MAKPVILPEAVRTGISNLLLKALRDNSLCFRDRHELAFAASQAQDYPHSMVGPLAMFIVTTEAAWDQS